MVWKASGSSPRVRGILNLAVGVMVFIRFIPACAGNTISAVVVIVGSAVHPRVCGEYPEGIFVCPLPLGSSPRVRGILHANNRRRES